jgi:hypothetical protein
VTDLASAIPELRRPFTPAAIKFKVQTNPKERGNGWSKALVVTYMDSRMAAERLNAVVPGDWHDEYEPMFAVGQGAAGVVCRLSVHGQSRSDVGFEQSVASDMGLKGLYSDAFKRAAVKFGIGAYLYALPKMYVEAGENTLKQVGKNWYLQRGGEQYLRTQYERWLALPATVERFGGPLDHGDAEDAQGEAVDVAPVKATVQHPHAPIAEAISEASAAKAKGVKLGAILTNLGVDATGGVKAAVARMSVDQLDAFRKDVAAAVLLVEAEEKLGAKEAA